MNTKRVACLESKVIRAHWEESTGIFLSHVQKGSSMDGLVTGEHGRTDVVLEPDKFFIVFHSFSDFPFKQFWEIERRKKDQKLLGIHEW